VESFSVVDGAVVGPDGFAMGATEGAGMSASWLRLIELTLLLFVSATTRLPACSPPTIASGLLRLERQDPAKSPPTLEALPMPAMCSRAPVSRCTQRITWLRLSAMYTSLPSGDTHRPDGVLRAAFVATLSV
jgi:hypothetical protein